MRRRWRSLVAPDNAEAHAFPDAKEALGVWLIGVLWALVCLWLGYAGGYWVIPGVLVAGVLALWGWRHVEWLWWFPTVLVIAAMLQPLSPLPMRTHFGPLVYTDLLVIGVALVSVVRAVALRRPLLPRTPVDGLLLAVVALAAVGFVAAEPAGQPLQDLKRVAVRIAVFYATVTVASRPRGSRWVWLAFPLACALLGLHAVWARVQGPSTLAEQVRIADLAWGSQHGIRNILFVALPITVGLSLNAGHLGARVLWLFACLCGTAAVTLHLVDLAAPGAWTGLAHRWTPLAASRTALAALVLATLAALAWQVSRGRPHESPRWTAMMVTFAGFAALELSAPALSGPATGLLAVAAGLVVGTLRADRRALRSGRVIAPLPRAA